VEREQPLVRWDAASVGGATDDRDRYRLGQHTILYAHPPPEMASADTDAQQHAVKLCDAASQGVERVAPLWPGEAVKVRTHPHQNCLVFTRIQLESGQDRDRDDRDHPGLGAAQTRVIDPVQTFRPVSYGCRRYVDNSTGQKVQWQLVLGNERLRIAVTDPPLGRAGHHLPVELRRRGRSQSRQ
jgi:hypothetical protein